MLRRDRTAVEGMPLTLMITVLIIAISVPLVFGSLKAFDKGRVDAQMRSEISDLTIMVQLVYSSGPGNGAAIDFQVPDGSLSGIDYVKVGDVLDGEFTSAIRYKISGSQETIIVIESPNVPLTSPENTALELPPGHYNLAVHCETTNTDINGDGIVPDAIVTVELTGL